MNISLVQIYKNSLCFKCLLKNWYYVTRYGVVCKNATPCFFNVVLEILGFCSPIFIFFARNNENFSLGF